MSWPSSHRSISCPCAVQWEVWLWERAANSPVLQRERSHPHWDSSPHCHGLVNCRAALDGLSPYASVESPHHLTQQYKQWNWNWCINITKCIMTLWKISSIYMGSLILIWIALHVNAINLDLIRSQPPFEYMWIMIWIRIQIQILAIACTYVQPQWTEKKLTGD